MGGVPGQKTQQPTRCAHAVYDVEELASAVQRYRDDIVTKRLAFAGLLSATAGLRTAGRFLAVTVADTTSSASPLSVSFATLPHLCCVICAGCTSRV